MFTSVDLGATINLLILSPAVPNQKPDPGIAASEPILELLPPPPPQMYVYEIFVNYSFYFSFYNIYLYLPGFNHNTGDITRKDNRINTPITTKWKHTNAITTTSDSSYLGIRTT